MPYKDPKKRKEYHREYYREYMRSHLEYRLSSESNRAKRMEKWKNDGIILYKFRRLSKKYGQLGIEVFLRDNCSCVKCGETDFRMLILDHIIPKSKGGKDEYDNLQTLCYNCHAVKHFMEDVDADGYNTQDEWDKYWMAFANFLGKYSSCLSRQIGGVLVKGNELLSIGWNGPPRGIPTCSERYSIDPELQKLLTQDGKTPRDKDIDTICPRYIAGFKSGEGLEWCVAGHAERNTIINAARQGIATKDAIMYMACGIPCSPCLVEIINAGIEEIIVTKLDYYDVSGPYLVENSDLKVRLYNFIEKK